MRMGQNVHKFGENLSKLFKF